jgi:hypothetical protein
METKIRMHIDSEINKIHLPKINFNSVIQFIKFSLRAYSFTKDQEMKEYIHSNKENLNQFIVNRPTDMNIEESLTLVDEFNILHLLMH